MISHRCSYRLPSSDYDLFGYGLFSILLLLLLSYQSPANSHPLAPGLLDLEEQANGQLQIHWKLPRQLPAGISLSPKLPENCTPFEISQQNQTETSLSLQGSSRCTAPGLIGQPVAITGLAGTDLTVLLRYTDADGRSQQQLLHGNRASAALQAAPSRWQLFLDYLVLGIEHLFAGLDHLLFVAALVLLIRETKSLLITVTAFTLGHSITLAAATLGILTFNSALVELLIALSIVISAIEVPDTANPQAVPPRFSIRRKPWLLALLFGLVHGMGFASVLREAGLPVDEVPLALLAFNLGIEAGQVLFILLLLLLALPVKAWLSRPQQALASEQALSSNKTNAEVYLLHSAALLIGVTASYWVWERALAL